MPAMSLGFWSGGYGRGRKWSSSGDYPNDPRSISLDTVPSGTRVKVKYVVGGWNALNRLASMGIVPGSEIDVVKNDIGYPWTPIIIRVNGVELALGRGIASRVIVEFLEET